MQIDFPYYHGIEQMDIPDDNLMGVWAYADQPACLDVAQAVREALRQPIGSPPVVEMAQVARRVVIVCDDNTRTTRADLILPILLAELEENGVRPAQLTILMGLGTHRPMSPAELRAKLGEDIINRYTVVNHDFRDLTQLVDMGRTARGIPVQVNRLAVEADLLIGLGHVVPHRVAGFSGGGKIIQPGICGEETTGHTHWLSARHPLEDIFARRDNAVREEIDAIARTMGLKMIVNTVQDSAACPVGVFAGDLEAAHRPACALATDMFGVELRAQADIVVADSYPADLDLWQAVKGLFPAGLAVRQDGVIILVTPCPEGVSDPHPELLEVGYRPLAEIEERVEAGQFEDLAVAAHLGHVSQVVVERARTIIVSLGISPVEAEQLGLMWAASPQEALDKAFALVGHQATVSVLRHGAEILPRLNREEKPAIQDNAER